MYHLLGITAAFGTTSMVWDLKAPCRFGAGRYQLGDTVAIDKALAVVSGVHLPGRRPCCAECNLHIATPIDTTCLSKAFPIPLPRQKYPQSLERQSQNRSDLPTEDVADLAAEASARCYNAQRLEAQKHSKLYDRSRNTWLTRLKQMH